MVCSDGLALGMIRPSMNPVKVEKID